MTEARDPALESLLLAEKAAYANRLRIRLTELESLVADGRIDDARRAAHKLSGSAGTYGYPAIGDAARELEEAIGRSNSADAKLLESLRAACEDAGRSAEVTK